MKKIEKIIAKLLKEWDNLSDAEKQEILNLLDGPEISTQSEPGQGPQDPDPDGP